MSRCSCIPSCGPSCGTQSTEIVCEALQGAYFAVYDEDGQPRRLVNHKDGIAVQDGGQARISNGSSTGAIPIDLKSVGGGDGVLVQVDNIMAMIGKESPNGCTIIKENGVWIAKPILDTRNQFDISVMPNTDIPAGLSCTNDNIRKLGPLGLKASSFFYVDEDGKFVYLTETEIAIKLMSLLCENMPEKAEDDVVIGNVMCAEDKGLVKGVATTSIVWVDNPPRVYTQNKDTYVIPEPDGIVGFPPFAPDSLGYFATNYVDVDLTDITGWTENAHTVIIELRGVLAAGSPLSSSWNVVCVIQGREYMRLVAHTSLALDSQTNPNCLVKIPEGGVIRIEGIRQSDGSSPSEAVTLEAFVKGFIQ